MRHLRTLVLLATLLLTALVSVYAASVALEDPGSASAPTASISK